MRATSATSRLRCKGQGSRGAGEQGSRGAREQGSRGAREQGSRGAGEQGSSRGIPWFLRWARLW
ncbi:MAG: hypothetical protein FJ014_15800 [Chloroflexi bacterium]|nr:hypothetical protein [Chloroflexota bacterium]